MAEDTWFAKADEVERIASEKVIPEWHPHLKALGILYVFVSKIPRKHGKIVLAKTKKADALRALAGR